MFINNVIIVFWLMVSIATKGCRLNGGSGPSSGGINANLAIGDTDTYNGYIDSKIFVVDANTFSFVIGIAFIILLLGNIVCCIRLWYLKLKEKSVGRIESSQINEEDEMDKQQLINVD
eukprot:177233_1